MPLDPIAVSRDISDGYLRYLRTLLPVGEPALRDAINKVLGSESELVAGPFLEATPPYESGASVGDLIEEGVLSAWLRRLGHDDGLPMDRPLYLHQEQAIRKAVTGRNLVVATGTGSGKTESFLLPILNDLAQEHANGTLDQPGVRALLLYPMNALANDQLKRLRGLLREMPEITFGRYTGETEQDPSKAEEKFKHQFPNDPLLPNELKSREEMQASPPHLLLTNYAMLEYLLLRPQDTALFDGATGEHWRQIVLDEAHVYDGASGIEVAMLLRRVWDRVAREKSVQFILTSATVGDSSKEVVDFASTFTSAPFEWVDGAAEQQDVVSATRKDVDDSDAWGELEPGGYRRVLTADARRALLTELGAPDGDVADVLASERRIQLARKVLAAAPVEAVDLAQQLFPDDERASEHLEGLVALAAATKVDGGAPLLPARYHLWVRAAEGIYTCIGPDSHARLTRHEQCPDCSRPMFELGACKRCNSTYLIGTTSTITGEELFEATKTKEKVPPTWLVLLGEEARAIASDLVDEDDETLETEVVADPPKHRRRWLCTKCRRVHDADGECQCGEKPRAVLEVEDRKANLQFCGLCGGRSRVGQIRRLESGRDASVSVLSTTLYQALPPETIEPISMKPGKGRKVLFFADSRQDAAWYAPYFEDTYRELVQRRVVYEAVKSRWRPDDHLLLEDVAAEIARSGEQWGLFDWKASRDKKIREASTWVHSELLSVRTAQSLEGLGLVSFGMRQPPGLSMPQPLLDLGLDDDEAWGFVLELLRTVRGQGVVTYPTEVDPRDEIFEPRLGPIFLRGQGPEPKKKVLSWVPGKGTSTRSEYVDKVLTALGATASAKDVLTGLWKWLTDGPAKDLLVESSDAALGVLWQIDHSLVTVGLVDAERHIHRCSRCLRVAPVSVRSVCPTFGCHGELEPWWPPVADDDHYRFLARELEPIPLRVSEHTAQFTATEAAAVQQQFLDGDLNALSCSTTFELGVDVGELQTVVLRNVPPSTSNYVQRAGRAGRRTDSAALVLTYAQRRSHDLTHFQQPKKMIAGEVRSPRVSLRNDRIARRHAHAVALAAWFRDALDERGMMHRTTSDLFGMGESESEVEHLKRWLKELPESVADAVARVIPADLHDRVGVTDGSWTNEMSDLIAALAEEHQQDVGAYKELETEASGEGKHRQAEMYQKTANTIEKRQLIGHLSAHNVLPKYGFPVDSVELKTRHVGSPAARKIELSRDLRMAISEYAPGSSVVAAGFEWTSAGLTRLPEREFPRRHYIACRCGWYVEGTTEPQIDTCPVCKADGLRKRIYITPEFGFQVKNERPVRPKSRPLRAYAGRAYLASSLDDVEEVVAAELELPNGGTAAMAYYERGRLVVVNEGIHQRGYRICRWCGYGEAGGGKPSSKHSNPLTGRECAGTFEWLSLGHAFETDVLQLTLHGIAAPPTAAVWWGLLYAIVEAAAERLQIARDDIDGTLHFGGVGPPTIVLYDDVPAGAGHVRRVRDHLVDVLEVARDRVANCECGEETSCYRCLRGYRNQWVHDDLRRGAVADLLTRALGAASSADDWNEFDTPSKDFRPFEGRVVRLATGERTVQGTLWIEETEDGQMTLLVEAPSGTEEFSGTEAVIEATARS